MRWIFNEIYKPNLMLQLILLRHIIDYVQINNLIKNKAI